MRDTPRTEVYVLDPLPQVVSADWARQLERELNAAKARVAELEARTREAEESNANALARLSAAEATIELRRIENEAVRHQVWHAENVCDAMEKRVLELEARCKRLEKVGDNLDSSIACGCGVDGPCRTCMRALEFWKQAKEAKP